MGMTSIADTVKEGHSVISAALNNVSAMEIYTIKRFFLNSMDSFLWLCPPEAEAAREEEDYNSRNVGQGSSNKRFKRAPKK
jgi:hypothetical protein